MVVCDEEREQSQGSEAAMRMTKSLFYGGNSRSAPKLVQPNPPVKPPAKKLRLRSKEDLNGKYLEWMTNMYQNQNLPMIKKIKKPKKVKNLDEKLESLLQEKFENEKSPKKAKKVQKQEISEKEET